MADTIGVGLAWYKPEQWPLLLEASSDRDALEDTYEEWVSDAETALKELRRQGMRVEKVIVDVPDIVRWCKDRNRPVNSEARSAYAAEAVHRANENAKGD